MDRSLTLNLSIEKRTLPQEILPRRAPLLPQLGTSITIFVIREWLYRFFTEVSFTSQNLHLSTSC